MLDATVPLGDRRVDTRGWDSRLWGETLRVAAWHRLSPVLFTHVQADTRVPAAVRTALERAYLASAARSLFLTSALGRVLDELRAAEVPALLLKGAALVETVYRDPAHREMLDLDILVPGEQMAAATWALEPLGYRPSSFSGEAADVSTQLELGAHHAPALVGEQRLVAIELHRHIAIPGEGTRFGIERIWERARPARKGDHLLPSAEDLLIHVCVHFTRNRLGGSYQHRNTGGALGQISDIQRIVEAEPLDWEALVASAREDGLGARVFLALFAARELGVDIPEDALSELEPSGFDPGVGRRLVALRVLRAGDHPPVRTLRWMVAPGRETLSKGWNADPTATLSLARAYARRAQAHVPEARAALRRPWLYFQDQRLNGQIRALEERV